MSFMLRGGYNVEERGSAIAYRYECGAYSLLVCDVHFPRITKYKRKSCPVSRIMGRMNITRCSFIFFGVKVFSHRLPQGSFWVGWLQIFKERSGADRTTLGLSPSSRWRRCVGMRRLIPLHPVQRPLVVGRSRGGIQVRLPGILFSYVLIIKYASTISCHPRKVNTFHIKSI